MNSYFPTIDPALPYTPPEIEHEYHGVVSVALCELIDGGFVKWYELTDEGVVPNSEWVWDYYDIDQYKRVCDKFNARFMWDEISMMPPLRWKQQVIRKFNEIMPKYKPIYKLLADGGDIMQVSNEYGKSRNIYSEFPQTLLNGESDYVSNGTDREYEIIKDGDWVEKVKDIANNYKDIDAIILDEMETLFSSLYSVNVNGW